jgi:hypothetical protein
MQSQWKEQELLGRTNCLRSFDTTLTAEKITLQKIFVAAGMSLLSCYLATIKGYFSNSSIVASIRCNGNVFAKLLPSDGKRAEHKYTECRLVKYDYIQTFLQGLTPTESTDYSLWKATKKVKLIKKPSPPLTTSQGT